MRTLKAIAILLHYPDENLQRHAGELAAQIAAEEALAPATRHAVAALIERFRTTDLLDLQAEYIGLFDRSRALSLHLFEHVHGESRDRGQAMVDLLATYRAQGLDIAAHELPDYVPLFLEFCSRLTEDEARDWLQQIAHLLLLLHGRLEQRGSDYAVLFQALLELGEVAEADEEFRRQLREEEPDDTPEALDRVWAEEPVSFGPTAACSGAVRTHGGQAVPVDVSRLHRA